jgi:hypothetical protein
MHMYRVLTPSCTRWPNCLIRASLLIVQPSILNLITHSIVSWPAKQNALAYTFALSPCILFFSLFFSMLSTWLPLVAASYHLHGVPPYLTLVWTQPVSYLNTRVKVSPLVVTELCWCWFEPWVTIRVCSLISKTSETSNCYILKWLHVQFWLCNYFHDANIVF